MCENDNVNQVESKDTAEIDEKVIGKTDEEMTSAADSDEQPAVEDIVLKDGDIERGVDALMAEEGITATGKEGTKKQEYYDNLNESLASESARANAKRMLARMGRSDAAGMIDKIGTMTPVEIDKAMRAGTNMFRHGKGKRAKTEKKKKKK